MNDLRIMEGKDALNKLSEIVNKYDIISFYGINNEKTIQEFKKLKDNTTSENVKSFTDSIDLDDFIKILRKMLKTNNAKDINKVEDLLINSHLSGMISDEAYIFFMEYCENKWINLLHSKRSTEKMSEKDYVEKIVESFSEIFPNYDFIKTEHTIKCIGRIDILAKVKNENTPVIIECKKKKYNPTKQLISYGSAFEKPVLIGITEEKIDKKNRKNGIIYLTYKEIGV